MSLSKNVTKVTARTPLMTALEHFSYNSNGFTNKIAKEIFRKNIFMPFLGLKSIKPYDYFNQHNDDEAFSSFGKAVSTNHAIYAASSYVYDCVYNINTSKSVSFESIKQNSEDSYLMWFADKVALPFVLSRFNTDPNDNLIGTDGLISIFGMVKTIKSGLEHISHEHNNFDQSYHNYQQENSVNNFNALFYSSIDLLGSFITAGLAFSFTCAVQNSIHQNNNQYINNIANLIVTYKVQTTTMFAATTAVEFLIKLPINIIYNFLHPNTEESVASDSNQPSSEAINQAADSDSKALIVYASQTENLPKSVPIANLIYDLALHNEKSGFDNFLKEHIIQATFLRMMEESTVGHLQIHLPVFDSTIIKIIDISGAVCLLQDA